MFDFSYIKDLSIFYNQYKPKDIVLVDADISQWSKVSANDDTKLHYIANSVSNFVDNQVPEAWAFYKTTLSDDGDEVGLYKYNLRFLDGQIPQDVLQRYWPNIRLKEQCRVQSILTEDFFATSFQLESNKFIIFEKLGAISSIKNLDFDVNNIVLIAARVVESEYDCISRSALSKHLESKGFREVALYADHFPKMGMVIYVRDFESESILYKQKYTSEHSKYEKLNLEKQGVDSNLATTLSQLKSTQGNLSAKTKELEIAKAESQAKEVEHKQKVESLDKVIATNKAEITKLSQEVQTKQQKIQSLDTKLVDIVSSNKKLLGQLSEKANDLIATVSELNSTKENLLAKTKELETAKADSQVKEIEYKEKVESLDKVIATNKAEISKLVQELESKEKKLLDKAKELEEHKSIAQNIQKQLDKYKSDIDLIKQSHNKIKQSLSEV